MDPLDLCVEPAACNETDRDAGQDSLRQQKPPIDVRRLALIHELQVLAVRLVADRAARSAGSLVDALERGWRA